MVVGPTTQPTHLSIPTLKSHGTTPQEARGLDAGDRLAQRLVGMGDNRTSAIVRRIAEEERAHVAVGAWLVLDVRGGPCCAVFAACVELPRGPQPAHLPAIHHPG